MLFWAEGSPFPIQHAQASTLGSALFLRRPGHPSAFPEMNNSRRPPRLNLQGNGRVVPPAEPSGGPWISQSVPGTAKAISSHERPPEAKNGETCYLGFDAIDWLTSLTMTASFNWNVGPISLAGLLPGSMARRVGYS